MKNRIKELRKINCLSQSEFGQKIGVSRDTVANLESGRIEFKDIFIYSICKEFNVNEEWLRTGQGEMYIPPDDETAALVENLLEEGKDNPFYATVLSALRIYDQQDQQGKEVLKAYFRAFIDDLKRNE